MKIFKKIKDFIEDKIDEKNEKKTIELYNGLDKDFLQQVRSDRKKVYENFKRL